MRKFEVKKLQALIEDLEALRLFDEVTLADRDNYGTQFGAKIDADGELYAGDSLGVTLEREHVPWPALHDAFQKALRARS